MNIWKLTAVAALLALCFFAIPWSHQPPSVLAQSNISGEPFHCVVPVTTVTQHRAGRKPGPSDGDYRSRGPMRADRNGSIPICDRYSVFEQFRWNRCGYLSHAQIWPDHRFIDGILGQLFTLDG